MENKNKAIDFNSKKKEIEKRKKEEEIARKKEKESMQFRKSIEADIQERIIHKIAKRKGIVDDDVIWTESTFKRVENIHKKLKGLNKKLKFTIKVLAGFAICLVVGVTIYSSYMHSLLYKQKEINKELEQTVAIEKKANFDKQLLNFKYGELDKLEKFIKNNNIKYSNIKNNGENHIEFTKDKSQYEININDNSHEIEFKIKKH